MQLVMKALSRLLMKNKNKFSSINMRSIATSDRAQTIGPNVFADFSKMAMEQGAVNLGQGFPNFGTPEFAKKACSEALMSDAVLNNQYGRPGGSPALLEIISEIYSPKFGRKLDPLTEIMTSCGAQQVLYEIMMAFLNPDDQVIVIEPYFDAYVNAAKVLGVEYVGVSLKADMLGDDKGSNTKMPVSSSQYKIDPVDLETAITPKTKMLVLNTPHNPIGKVMSMGELEQIAEIMRRHPDIIIVSDEVYEHMVFDNNKHHRFATIPDMEDRTLSVYSAGKTFSATGWRVGYCIAHPKFITPLVKTQQITAFCNAIPLELGVAEAFRQTLTNNYYAELAAILERKRDSMVKLLDDAGLTACVPEGGYFVMSDTSRLPIPVEANDSDMYKELTQRRDFRAAQWLTKEAKVTGIPPSAFYTPVHRYLGDNMIRFCFAKDDDTIKKAGEQLLKAKLLS